jgi:predicted PolB exonuclease-like 3'-5' exonuclease
MTRLFWNEVCSQRPTLVTFNGRSFDLPLMELAAFRWGLAVPTYFTDHQGPRNRFSERHIDLQEFVGNYGASRTGGGLNLLAKLLGKPGKMDVDGSKVYDMYAAGKLAEINDYCLCDALDTYFVFLRTRLLIGRINRERERVLIERVKALLAPRAAESATLAKYLSCCRDWEPWPGAIPAPTAATSETQRQAGPARRGGLA